jgi:pentatricopeptide repeat protein
MVKGLKTKLETVATWLLYSTALVPLLYSGNFFYPFIVPRTVFFRIIIEIVLIIFLVLWYKYGFKEKTREILRRNYLFLILTMYIVLHIVSGLFGASWINSLFGDIERSWGIYTLMHAYLFYVLARTFFNRKSWRKYFHALLGSTSIVALYGIIQYYPNVFKIELFNSGPGRILSTLGNPAYVSIVLLFGICIALYLSFSSKEKNWKYFYWAIAVIQFFAFTLTEIRGAYLGLVGGLIVAGILRVITSKSKKVKTYSAGFVIIILIGLSILFISGKDLSKNSIPIISRLSAISLESSTSITRLIGWKSSLNGFSENPILGVGPENFGVVFNKYFDPLFYTYAAREPFFDRAHNHFLDLLSTVGTLGLVSYLLLIFAIYWYLYRGYKNEKLLKKEFQLFAGIFVAYFIHLFFVFDDINSLLIFFGIIGFLEYKISEDNIFEFSESESKPTQTLFRIPVSAFFIILVVWAGFGINTNIVQSSQNTLKGTFAQEMDDLESASKFYIASLSDSRFPRVTSIRKFLDFVVIMANNKSLIQDAKGKELFDSNISAIQYALKEEIQKNKFEPRLFTDLATVHTIRYIIDEQDIDKDLSIAYIKQAISLTPDRPQYYNLLSESYVIFNEPEKAIQAAQTSFAMNENYNETYIFLVSSYTKSNDLDKAFSYYQEFLKKGYQVRSDDAAAKLGQKFIENSEPQKAEQLYNLWLEASTLEGVPENSKVLINLTIVSLILDNPEQAISYAKRAVLAKSSLEAEVNYIIQEIEQGRVEALLEQILE